MIHIRFISNVLHAKILKSRLKVLPEQGVLA
jgi:hypothetical protein